MYRVHGGYGVYRVYWVQVVKSARSSGMGLPSRRVFPKYRTKGIWGLGFRV